jgi:hypothetical protein
VAAAAVTAAATAGTPPAATIVVAAPTEAGAAAGRGRTIGGIHFPPGYPISFKNRKLSYCSECHGPLSIPDQQRPGELKKTSIPINQLAFSSLETAI